MSTAALVLGIIGLVFSFIPGINYIGAVCALLAIIFGALAVKKGQGKAGLILGIIAFVLSLILTFACVIAAAGASSYINSLF